MNFCLLLTNIQANYCWGQMHCGPPNQNFGWAGPRCSAPHARCRFAYTDEMSDVNTRYILWTTIIHHKWMALSVIHIILTSLIGTYSNTKPAMPLTQLFILLLQYSHVKTGLQI